MNQFKHKNWMTKFGSAFVGVARGIRGQGSFYVHLPVAAVVLMLAVWLRLDEIRGVLLLICISSIFVCELINSSIEKLATSITNEYDENVRDALDIASGAVLVAAIFATVIGGIILGPPVWQFFAS